MTQRIFTTGYTGKDVGDLRPMLEALDAMLIDIRFAPYSRIMHWQKVYLKALLGERYRHVSNLGNRTYKEEKITIQNLKLGLETVFSIGRNAVLMCACERAENCHRRLIIEELRRQEVETQELLTWKTRDPSFQTDLF
ncbi:MAG: hypothetical protein R2747_17860 [Pyrinomonadaceae bacterium]